MDLFEYVLVNGAQPFSERPFCAVDSLCLSLLSYLPLGDYISHGFESRYTVRELCGLYLIYQEECERVYTPRFSKDHTRFFRLMAKSRRFSELSVCGYRQTGDAEKEMQFAALTVLFDEGAFLSFRGTDDTLVAWKEDFNMCFLPTTPSQLAAAEYLADAAAFFEDAPLFLGGHSKGGNLALFAAATGGAKTQSRIVSVYLHDAPGFLPEFFESGGFYAVESRCHAYVPQTSIVGVLLENPLPKKVVRATSRGLLQHAPYTWLLEGEDFVYADETDRHSRYVDRALTDWLAGLQLSEREAFVDALFELLTSSEADNFTDLTHRVTHSVPRIYRGQKEMDGEKREMLKRTVEHLFSTAWATFLDESGIKQTEEEIKEKLTLAYRPVRRRLRTLVPQKEKPPRKKEK